MKSPIHQWIDPQFVSVSAEMVKSAGGSAFLAEMLVRRGIVDPQIVPAFFNPGVYFPADPFELPDIEKAVLRLEKAIQISDRIGVWGDFDVDGQTSTALLVQTLRELGADVIYHVPVRSAESHGVNLPGLQRMIQGGAKLILTCDTGITAHEAAAYCRSQSIDLLITDHHTLPAQLPDAFAVINPNLLSTDHPLHPLCGVGVAFELASGLLQHFQRNELTNNLLDLVALGTIADLALLVGDNRYLVQCGLNQIRANQRFFIQRMLNSLDIDYTKVSEEHIAFFLAPRLNALGRLEDANPAVEFLQSKDQASIDAFLLQIETLNGKRKLLCDQVFRAAIAQIEKEPSIGEMPAIILHHPAWPAGVIGIVASRLVELYHRPVVLLSTPPGEPARGSARSIEGIDITAAISENQQWLKNFGGHPMAAGLALDPDNIPKFIKGINRSIEKSTQGKPPILELTIDAFLTLDHITMDLIQDLDRLAPFGPGNPAPILATRNLLLKSATTIGRGGEHLQCIVEDEGGSTRKILWWQGAGSPFPEGRFDLAYHVRGSNYRGKSEVQIEWVSWRAVEEKVTPPRPTFEPQVFDYRAETDPESALSLVPNDAIVWCEGEIPSGLQGVNRLRLSPAPSLVIWNPPPGRQELQAALKVVKPERVFCFNFQGVSNAPEQFLERLAGLVRFALNKRSGQVSIPELAAATGQSEVTVKAGLDWWEGMGDILLSEKSNSSLHIEAGKSQNINQVTEAEKRLRTLLQETASFRKYYLKSDASTLVS